MGICGWARRNRLQRDMRRLSGGMDMLIFLDCGHGFMVVYICQNSSKYIIYVCIVHCISVIPQ